MAETPRNLLSSEDSPYLLQHAGNPVAWMPWGEAAFARARAENKPIFLSIGYSTCHWCHVMEHESFENESIAAFLNEHYVSVKVDREERPDVDLIHMTYVQATTGHGGWPMTVFLTPDGLPFFGGTYFPPEDWHGRTGFLNLITRIAEIWSSRPDDILESARSAFGQLRVQSGRGGTPGEPPAAKDLARAATRAFAKQFDATHGGFGTSPKFPRPSAPSLLLEVALRWPAEAMGKEAGAMVLATLQAMADGGIHDHLGGGFHRYSVDRQWHIPHYEKMLYDQAQLAPLYLEAWRRTANPAFAAVAENLFAHVLRDLMHPEGGFCSAEDADSLPEKGAAAKKEGAFYVFTAAELESILDPEALALFAAAYGVIAEGNTDPASDPHGELTGTNTLYRAAGTLSLSSRFNRPPAEIESMLAEAKAKVLAYRGLRPRPHRDDKIVLGWNGLMIGALAMGGRLLGRTGWTSAAEEAARAVIRHPRAPDGSWWRCRNRQAARAGAFASDLTQWISGLLDLHEATGKMEWLELARECQDELDDRHRDPDDGCYFSAREDGKLSLLSLKEDHDGAEPSPDSLGALNLLRLHAHLGGEQYLEAAERIISAHADDLERAPHVAPLLAVAAIRLEMDPGHAVIAPSDHPEAAPLLRAVLENAPPGLAILRLPGAGPGRAALLARHPWMESLPSGDEPPSVHICRDQSCGLPLRDAGSIAFALRHA
jgi:uncharacterized protein YyaL (SSP411 family)